jgi:hypothetical protein
VWWVGVSAPDVPAGVWRHWKGADYLVLGLGHDADVADRVVVVYVPLYPVPGPQLAVRTVESFLAEVSPGVRRFTFTGGD